MFSTARTQACVAKVLAKGKGANVRLALGNLYRAGAPTGPVVMALYGVARAAGLDSVSVSWTGGVALAMVATLVMLAVGWVATLGAYTTTPARVLRDRRL